jgi:hypothetical protein
MTSIYIALDIIHNLEMVLNMQEDVYRWYVILGAWISKDFGISEEYWSQSSVDTEGWL